MKNNLSYFICLILYITICIGCKNDFAHLYNGLISEKDFTITMKNQLIVYPKNGDKLTLKNVLRELNFNSLKFGSTYVEALSKTADSLSIDFINEQFRRYEIEADIVSYIPVYDSSDIHKYEYFYCASGKIVDTAIKILPENDFLQNKSFDCSDFCEKCMLGMKQEASLSVKGINKSKIENQKLLISSNGLWFISENLMNIIINN